MVCSIIISKWNRKNSVGTKFCQYKKCHTGQHKKQFESIMWWNSIASSNAFCFMLYTVTLVSDIAICILHVLDISMDSNFECHVIYLTLVVHSFVCVLWKLITYLCTYMTSNMSVFGFSLKLTCIENYVWWCSPQGKHS